MSVFSALGATLGTIESILGEVVISAIPALWNGFVFVLVNGGWVLFAAFLFWMWFMNRWIKKLIAFGAGLDWTFLNVSIPGVANTSIMSAEQIFIKLYGVYRPLDWKEVWIDGNFNPHFSFELVSLGGLIRYIIRVPRDWVDITKSAIFAQYPDAEITEVDDYMNALPTPYMPDTSDYDFWGTDLMLTKEEAYPIKTYPYFEHRAAEVIIDPLAALLETMANVGPEEIIAIQFLFMPDSDDWKKGSKDTVEKLKGKPEDKDQQKKEPNLLRYLSETEKDTLKAVQSKLSKLSFNGKIKVLYAAPKGDLQRRSRQPAIMGSFTQFTQPEWNGFKANRFVTTSKPDPKISKRFEGTKLEAIFVTKKRKFIDSFKGRSFWDLGNTYHLSTEELATLFHFPIEGTRRSAIEQTDAKKAEPPVNLPI